VEGVVISPREDFMMALAGDRATQWEIDAPYPEINAKALLSRIWYEGYDAPAYVWQSSSGTDSFEPKYSLIPLIFGTLKATVYSLLIGLPLAWFAAVYTSEFLSPRARARIKPTIELMASLPSVVLGFLAALVFAPFLERWVPEVLTAVVAIPVCFLTGAYLWQLASREWTLRFGYLRLPFMALGLPAGVLIAWALGGWVEHAFFGGDIMSWLDGQQGSAVGGWIFILMVPSAALVFFVQTQVVDGWLRSTPRLTTRMSFALADLGRFLLGLAATVVLALFAGWVLAAAGVDPRGAVVDTYVQRNALVVGVVMGFAIIPIIYTISEDALSAVPDHLRAASLGAGATPWQTALRVVIPPATSGLFSAMMIGLGRAVGETMIVLMAAGNTPIMEWNVFNGFRTLSANIAVELPEAVRNSTHYRTLFLAALTLFAITFVLNTAAEAVRMRFRKKSLEL
jgi:phosphate transport system permease protein